MTDIIIGARKARPRKSRRLLWLLLLFGFAYGALRISVRMLTSVPNPDVSVSSDLLEVSSTRGVANRSLVFDSATLRSDPLTVLRVGGTPNEIGGRAGRLLGADLVESTRALDRASRRADDGLDWAARFLGRERGDWFLRHVVDGIPGHQLVELAAIERGAKRSGVALGLRSLIAAQAAYDLGRPDLDTVGAQLRAITRGLTIVSPLRGASGERLLVGRMFSSPGLASAKSVVRFVRPSGVLAFASIGDPSVAGVVSGINEEGLTLMVHPIVTLDRPRSQAAQPIALISRDILENARTAEQAVAVLEAATPLGSAIFVIVSPASKEAVIVERTPERFGIRRSAKNQVVVDLLESDALADEPESERNRRLRNDAARAAVASGLLAEQGPRSATDLVSLMRSREDSSGNRLAVGDFAALADPTADHVVVIDPAALVLWVGRGPGAQGVFKSFDLRHELRGEGGEPTAPADVEAASADAIAAAAAVIKARLLLERARKSERNGNRRKARDLATQALLVAPTLPDARELAAELAEADGDRPTAEQLPPEQ